MYGTLELGGQQYDNYRDAEVTLISRVVLDDANVNLLLKGGFISCLGHWRLVCSHLPPFTQRLFCYFLSQLFLFFLQYF